MRWDISSLLLLFLFIFMLNVVAEEYHGEEGPPSKPYQDIFLGESVLVRTVSNRFLESSPGVKQGSLVTCTRLRIPGVSRFRNVKKFANSFRVKIEASSSNYKPVKSSNYKPANQICFHWNESLEVGQCSKDSWHSLEKGSWSATMSPYETRFLDIRTIDAFTEQQLTVSVIEELWSFRILFLGVGFLLLLAAPVVSSWLPFYYGSAMTLGIILVVLILLYQGMKLLPTGRKSTLYITFFGSVAGMGTVFVSYFARTVSSALKELGFGDDMYNPVALLFLFGVIFLGAWLGYWGVRKLVVSEDGSVDVGTAHFVKWAMRLIGSVMILQSSHDPLFAVMTLALALPLASLVTSIGSQGLDFQKMISFSWPENLNCTRSHLKVGKHSRTNFLCKSNSMQLKPQTKFTQKNHSTTLDQTFIPHYEGLGSWKDFYSSFHRTPEKRKTSKTEWESFTQEYTQKSVSDLVTSPNFSDWVVNNADRIAVVPNEHREDRPEREIQMTANMGEGGFLTRIFNW